MTSQLASGAIVGGIAVLSFVSALSLPVFIGELTPFGMPFENVSRLFVLGLPAMGLGVVAYWLGARYERS